MANSENEDVMHKRETLMGDGRRKMFYFTFDENTEVDGTAHDAQTKEVNTEDTVNE